jgi:hypothetical protein
VPQHKPHQHGLHPEHGEPKRQGCNAKPPAEIRHDDASQCQQRDGEQQQPADAEQNRHRAGSAPRAAPGG